MSVCTSPNKISSALTALQNHCSGGKISYYWWGLAPDVGPVLPAGSIVNNQLSRHPDQWPFKMAIGWPNDPPPNSVKVGTLASLSLVT